VELVVHEAVHGLPAGVRELAEPLEALVEEALQGTKTEGGGQPACIRDERRSVWAYRGPIRAHRLHRDS